VGWALCPALVACGGDTVPDDARESARCVSGAGPGSTSEALVAASDATPYAALSARERGALGRFGTAATDALCSGVRIAPSWALTAGHCAGPERTVFYGDDGGVQEVTAWLVHPEVDVALASLGAGDCGTFLPLVDPERTPSRLSRATLAGYGLDGEGELGRLGFLVEKVVSVTPDAVEVSGFGASGACVGDSGGPLLVRDEAGRVGVLGVLSTGAASCVETDHYLRVEPLLAWLRALLELPEAPDACGAIDARGRCFDGRAVYCEDGRLRSDPCDAGTHCGLALDAGGFRCAAEPLCDGDAFGACDASAAIRCDEGGATVTPCDVLGRECGYDPRTGVATCR